MELLTDQKEAFDKLKRYKVGALFMGAGTGKTRAAIELIRSVEGITDVFWFTPCQTKANLKAELKKWGFDAKIYGIESFSASDRLYLTVRNEIEVSEKPFMVIDESLKIKNLGAKRTKRLLDFSQFVDYKLILNGTPFTKNLLDLWAQIYFLSPNIMGMGIHQFKHTFCKFVNVRRRINGRTYEKEFIVDYTNIEYLYSLINEYIYECDLRLELSQNHFHYDYQLTKKEKKEHEAIKDKYLNDEVLMAKNDNIFLEITQKMQHNYCCSPDKFRVLDALFTHIPIDKTLIFCKYVKSAEECQNRYPAAKVLTYGKNAFGLNLQGYNHTIYFDKTWDYAAVEQGSKRTYRVGQENDCHYYDLTGDVGLERLMAENIDKKGKMLEHFKKTGMKEFFKII